MSKLFDSLRTLLKCERGQALVEYGLILALIALIAIIGVTAMGNDVDGMYEVISGIATAMANALGA